MINRRKLGAITLAVASGLAGGVAVAGPGPYPTGPIKLIVAFPPGGSQDVAARILAQKVGSDLGQPVVVDNKSGGGGVIGAQAAARSMPDGYTLMQMTPSLITASLLMNKVPYDWARDFTPVFGIHQVPLALFVSASSKTHSIGDVTVRAQASADGLSYSSGGAGLSLFLSAFLVQTLKIKATHVPYRGIADATLAVISGQVEFSFASLAELGPLVQAGKARLIAVSSEQRLPGWPQVPTLREVGVPITGTSWSGFAVPAKTPADVIERLHNSFTKAADDPAVQERLARLGMAYKPMNPAEFAKFLHDESVTWRRVIEDNKLSVENQAWKRRPTDKMRVGFVGVGRLGFAIAANLLRTGFPLTVSDVQEHAVAGLVKLGAAAAGSPADVAAASDLIGLCVRDDAQVLDVVGGKGGLLERIRPGSVLILHSTIHPDTCRRVEEMCRARGADFIDVEVSGYVEKAISGELTLLIGGQEEVVTRCEPYLRAIGRERFHLGPVGMGSVAKLANNVMAIVGSLGTYEGLNVARANGIDVNKMMEVAFVSSGDSNALRQWKVQGWKHGPKPDPFEILGSNSVYVLGVALKVARQRGIDLPIVAAVLEVVERLRQEKAVSATADP